MAAWLDCKQKSGKFFNTIKCIFSAVGAMLAPYGLVFMWTTSLRRGLYVLILLMVYQSLV